MGEGAPDRRLEAAGLFDLTGAFSGKVDTGFP
jgi:hypothetical protein